MNNDIKEDYCSFEVSKLLKEKGFGAHTHELWVHETEYIYRARLNHNTYSNRVSQPTHALAIKWIRENFKLSIEIYWKNTGKIFFGTVYPISPLGGQCHFTTAASTHEAATENAIMHTLKNLL